MCCKKMITILVLVFFWLFMVFGASASENINSIAVAADGPGPEEAVSEKAGRAAYFLFFDGSGKFLAAEKNSFTHVPGGAGPKVADYLSRREVSLVVAGDFGAKMERALSSYQIKYLVQTGVADEVVQKVIKEE